MFQKYTNYPIWGGLLVRFCIILDNLLMLSIKKGDCITQCPFQVCVIMIVCM